MKLHSETEIYVKFSLCNEKVYDIPFRNQNICDVSLFSEEVYEAPLINRDMCEVFTLEGNGI
jgi:hypothetical protein